VNLFQIFYESWTELPFLSLAIIEVLSAIQNKLYGTKNKSIKLHKGQMYLIPKKKKLYISIASNIKYIYI
jgi:hypothetical protein